MRRRTFWLILGVLAAVRLALMALVPVFEPSEARYAAIAANMARSGDFVVPRFTHNLEYQSFDGKPPLVFQAGGLFVKAIGDDAPWKLQLAVRIFPFLSASLLLAILFFSVRRQSDVDTARLAVTIAATSTAFLAASGISMTDMTLACSVSGALLLYRVFIDRASFPLAAAIAALLGVGLITKGPVALVMFGLPVLLDALVNRRWKAMFSPQWLLAAPVFFVVAVPWFVLMEQRNPGSTWYFFYNENFLRFVSHDYGDKYGAGREAFRGVSVLWALVATLPWSLVLLHRPKFRNPFSTSWLRAQPFETLAILAIVGFWCLTSRVLVYYLFPVIALFAAALAMGGSREFLRRLAVPAAAVSLVVLVGGLVGGSLFSEKMRGASTPFELFENHYAYEFYHGRKSDAELLEARTRRNELIRSAEEAWRRRQAEQGNGGVK